MGYKPSGRLIKVRLQGFTDPDDTDAEEPLFWLRPMGIGEVETLVPLAERASASIDGPGVPDHEEVSSIGAIFEMVGGAIQRWNFEDDDGEPLPINDTTFRAWIDLPMLLGIVEGWLGSIEVAAPLGGGSPNGKPPPVLAEAMEPS